MPSDEDIAQEAASGPKYRMHPKKIAVTVSKGGTGKTTTASNLGLSLGLAGYRVLLVDLDPQLSLTIRMKVEPAVFENRSLVDRVLFSPELSLDRLATKTEFENIDLVSVGPSAHRNRFHLMNEGHALTTARKVFTHDPKAGEYEIIIFDTPASSSDIFTTIGIFSADHLLMPVMPDAEAFKSIEGTISRASTVLQEPVENLPLLGTLINGYNPRESDQRMYHDFIREQPAARVFETNIPYSTVFRKGLSRRTYLHEIPSSRQVTDAYVRFVNEVISRINQPLAGRHRDS